MLNQMLNLTKLSLLQSRQQLRHISSNSSIWSCSHLSNRSVLKVSGDDTVSFLQGLVTNDVESLGSDQQSSLYCMFLNTQGRILFDALIYKGREPTDFLLDIDKNVAALAKKHMSMYKIRKKVKLELMENLSVFATFKEDTPVNPPSLTTQSPEIGSTFCSGGAQTPGLEGADEVGVAKSTPLEFNLDYLHGVSFHKGCYLGQELTARTHHTGVIRKRILPLRFDKQVEYCDSSADINVVSEKGKNVGKVKKVSGNVGLGLLRLKETFDAEKLTFGDSDTIITVSKPAWWPVEKDKNKSEA